MTRLVQYKKAQQKTSNQIQHKKKIHFIIYLLRLVVRHTKKNKTENAGINQITCLDFNSKIHQNMNYKVLILTQALIRYVYVSFSKVCKKINEKQRRRFGF